MKPNPAEVVTAVATSLSPYPPSFGNNPWAYGAAFASILSIAVFGVIVVGWMLRDIWRDRKLDHPYSLVFQFRFMVLCASAAALIRSFPEIVYMSLYGDPAVDDRQIALVLTVKRAMDAIALPIVSTWMGVLVSIYPFVIIALRNKVTHTVQVDPVSSWPRVARPAGIFALVVVISSLLAVAKGYGLKP
jgi:hypothetical protein